MQTKTINEFKFIPKTDSVVVVYRYQSTMPQAISFSNHHNHRKENMEAFKQQIMAVKNPDINEVYRIAIKNDMRGCSISVRNIIW